MSQENVKLVCRAIDAFNRRDLDALLALADDEVEAVPWSAASRSGTLSRVSARCSSRAGAPVR